MRQLFAMSLPLKPMLLVARKEMHQHKIMTLVFIFYVLFVLLDYRGM